MNAFQNLFGHTTVRTPPQPVRDVIMSVTSSRDSSDNDHDASGDSSDSSHIGYTRELSASHRVQSGPPGPGNIHTPQMPPSQSKTRQLTSEEPESVKMRAVTNASRDQLEESDFRRRRAVGTMRMSRGQNQELSGQVLGLQAQLNELMANYASLQKEMVKKSAQAVETNEAFKSQIEASAREVEEQKEEVERQKAENDRQRQEMARLDQERTEAVKRATEKQTELLALKNSTQRQTAMSTNPTASTPSIPLASPGTSSCPSTTTEAPPNNANQTESCSSSIMNTSSTTFNTTNAPPFTSTPSHPSTSTDASRNNAPSQFESASSPTSSAPPQTQAHPVNVAALVAEVAKQVANEILTKFAAGAPSSGSSPGDGGSSPSSTSRPTTGSAAHRAAIRRQIKADLPRKTWSSFQAKLRQVLRDCTGMARVNNYASYSPVDADKLAEFDEKLIRGPKSREYRYHLYFGEDWAGAHWNKIVVENMVNRVLQIHGDISSLFPDDATTRLNIDAALWGKIEEAQESWARYNPRVDSETHEIESPSEARWRATVQVKEQQERKMFTGRKRRKFCERRKAIDAKIEQLTKPDALDCPVTLRWKALRLLNDTLKEDGQSSDEDTAEHPTLKDRTVPSWRRRGIVSLMTEIDEEVLIQLRSSKDKGKARNIRRPSDLTSKSRKAIPPKALPADFYRKRFVRGLTRTELALLDIDKAAEPHPLLNLFPDSDESEFTDNESTDEGSTCDESTGKEDTNSGPREGGQVPMEDVQ
ncbi:hypothetical protein V5O48_011339 [Marasmius crinis-equi]|uniref:Uncharacterized protein n=1 Tax=Marasmius crinis-equi TaxID=585013 RepID=A0ABR3F6B8_9AGAR